MSHNVLHSGTSLLSAQIDNVPLVLKQNLSEYLENYRILNQDVHFLDRIYGVSKGGGSFFGKIKLSLRTAYYIVKYRYGNNNT